MVEIPAFFLDFQNSKPQIYSLSLIYYYFIITVYFQGVGPLNNNDSFIYGGSRYNIPKGVDYVNSTTTSQYGCFTSFSGCHAAQSWTLDLDRKDC